MYVSMMLCMGVGHGCEHVAVCVGGHVCEHDAVYGGGHVCEHDAVYGEGACM